MKNKIINFFGLSRIPFSKIIGVNNLFPSYQLKESFARLELALQNEDIALITGAVGNGKSTAIRYFTQQLDPNVYKVIYIPAGNMKIGEIAKRALIQLQIEVPFNPYTAFRKLKQSIEQLNKEKGIKPILVIDEAQELPVLTLKALKNIINFQIDSENYLFLLLCGQKELLDILDLQVLESLRRRIRIQYEIGALTLEETSKYISHQLKICGVEKSIFTEDTKSQIFTISKGSISRINQLCFELLILAVSESKDIIEVSMLEKIATNHL